jgi:hypothetical protein
MCEHKLYLLSLQNFSPLHPPLTHFLKGAFLFHKPAHL